MAPITKRGFLADACPEAKQWAKPFKTLAEAWDACPNSEWMLWALRKLGYDDQMALRRFACWCVRNTPLADGRKVWDLLTDERSRRAVEVAEAFADGKATKGERDAAGAAAGDAAGAAADAARAAADAAWDAAGAAAGDAGWDAAGAAADAARAAADAARAAAGAAAGDAGWDAAWAAQASALREFVRNPFI